MAELSAPPRSKPFPSVWISTLPEVVEFTVPVRFTLLAVRVIRPPFENMFDVSAEELMSITELMFPDVLPETLTSPMPVAEMLDEEGK